MTQILDADCRNLAQLVGRLWPSRRVALCTDEVLLRPLAPVLGSLRAALPRIEVFAYPGGECRKTRETKALLEDRLLGARLGRDSVLLALGGGTVTDLVGFTAGTYLRSVPYLNLPTTLLAMVDAAHGGKVAVNTPRGKNLVGLFYPAEEVFLPMESLDTLPPEEFLCGLAECIKHGWIDPGDFLTWMVLNRDGILRRDPRPVGELVERSIRVKRAIVEADPREEAGSRNLLNVGHTVAHALELLSAYGIPHGMAVAEGLLWEAGAALHQGYLDEASWETLASALSGYGFGVDPGRAPEAILEASASDKKNRSGDVAYVPMARVGVPALPPPHTAPLPVSALRAAGERISALTADRGAP